MYFPYEYWIKQHSAELGVFKIFGSSDGKDSKLIGFVRRLSKRESLNIPSAAASLRR
jgi:hypothetical protein